VSVMNEDEAGSGVAGARHPSSFTQWTHSHSGLQRDVNQKSVTSSRSRRPDTEFGNKAEFPRACYRFQEGNS